MNRDDAVWYYRLGGQTLGPVSWAEIEELTRDAVEADSLLVARGGDQGWTNASEAAAAHPELAAAATPAVAPQPAAVEPAHPEPVTSAGWTTPEPSAAAEEVLGGAAVVRDTRAPVAPEVRGSAYPNEMPTKHGLGAWIGQAWEMVTRDAVAYIFGTLLAVLVTLVTLGICGPPMQAGLFAMALKSFRKQEISPGTVFEGFQYFLPSWGVLLLQGIIGGVIGAVLGGGIGAVLGGAGASQDVIAGIGQMVGSIVSLCVAAAFFYAMVLVVDSNTGTIDAISASWEMTKPEFMSYVGTVFVLQLVAAAGAIACGVGVFLTAPMLPCAIVAAYMYHMRRR